MNENSVLIFRPVVTVRAERVAEVMQMSIDEANKLLSQPETKTLLEENLHRAFQQTVTQSLSSLCRKPLVAVPANRVDAAVALPQLPSLQFRVG